MIKVKCNYYPCHNGLEDCTFCFCPLYPCFDTSKGYLLTVYESSIWACENCNWIHKIEVVQELIKHPTAVV
jgi:Zn-finger protein